MKSAPFPPRLPLVLRSFRFLSHLAMTLTVYSSGLLLTSLLFGTLLRAAQTDSKAKTVAPLGLVRLATEPVAGKPAPLNAVAFEIDSLAAGAAGDVTRNRKDAVDYLEISAGREWSRPLRGGARATGFVSFQLYASQTTIVEIDGVRLGFTAGPQRGSLQLMFDTSANGIPQWRALNQHFSTGRYGPKELAAPPTLTVRLDPVSETWDLYVGSRLFAAGLPQLPPKNSQRQFNLRAGSGGAWLGGLVLADENPLYEDDNVNGIDDRFERSQRGAILPASASLVERKLLAEQWKDAQRTNPPAPLALARVLPDRQFR